jgi:hypothetical protein
MDFFIEPVTVSFHDGADTKMIIKSFFKKCSFETHMNVSLHPKHENLVNTGYGEGSPPQGLGTARRGKFGFREMGIETAAGAPPRGRRHLS